MGTATIGTQAAGATPDDPEAVLRRPPFPPTDPDLFVDAVYEEATPVRPARSAPLSDSRVRAELHRILEHRLPEDPEAVGALSLYDDPRLRGVVPDPRLRAAVVATRGTIAEPAIDAIRNGGIAGVRFAPFEDDVGVMAHTVHTDGECDLIEVNERYRFEDVRLFGPTLLHETLHHDRAPSPTEELIAHALDACASLELLLRSPELAHCGTALARWLNTDAMARLNGRDPEGRLRVLTSQGDVFPGGLEVARFADKVEGRRDTTRPATTY